MRSYRHLVPELRLFYGPDSLQSLPRELERLNSRRAVIFCGNSLVQEEKALSLIQNALGEKHAGTLSLVQSHSPSNAVMKAAQELARLNADAIIAVGGGSAIVTARAASILLAEKRDPKQLCTSRDESGALHSPKLLSPKLPQLIIPTTPTTATLKAGSAVLDPESGQRLALFDPKTRAKAVFIHPDVISTAPDTLVVSASLNTLAMALEGLMSKSGDPFSDALLMNSVRVLILNLPKVSESDAISVRGELMMASLLCAHATDYTGAGIAIPLGHAVSAKFHVDNGLTNAAILPHVVRFNAEQAYAGLEKTCSALGHIATREIAVTTVIQELEALFETLGIPKRLRDFGVPRASLTDLAEISMDDWFIRDNPRQIHNASDLLTVLECAW